jgi:hypothetical protein
MLWVDFLDPYKAHVLADHSSKIYCDGTTSGGKAGRQAGRQPDVSAPAASLSPSLCCAAAALTASLNTYEVHVPTDHPSKLQLQQPSSQPDKPAASLSPSLCCAAAALTASRTDPRQLLDAVTLSCCSNFLNCTASCLARACQQTDTSTQEKGEFTSGASIAIAASVRLVLWP